MTQDNSIVIREYLTTDKEVVMNLIKLNTPNFFAKEEVNDLSNYLDKEIELYYVLLVDGKVVGYFRTDFRRIYLEENIVFLNDIPHFHRPRDNRPFGYTLAQLRHFYFES